MADRSYVYNLQLGLWQLLTTDQTFNTLMGGGAALPGRIYEAYAPNEAVTPYCVFANQGMTILHALQGRVIEWAVRVSVYGTRAEVYDAAEKLKLQMDFKAPNVGGGTFASMTMVPETAIGPVRIDGGDIHVFTHDYVCRAYDSDA